MVHRPILGLAAEQITIGGSVPPNWLVLAGNVIQYPPYEGIPVVGTRNDGVRFPPGFVLAVPFSLSYPVMKGSVHIPLNQIQLLITLTAIVALSRLPVSLWRTSKSSTTDLGKYSWNISYNYRKTVHIGTLSFIVPSGDVHSLFSVT